MHVSSGILVVLGFHLSWNSMVIKCVSQVFSVYGFCYIYSWTWILQAHLIGPVKLYFYPLQYCKQKTAVAVGKWKNWKEKEKKKILDCILFYNIFTKCWYSQPFIDFHLGLPLISFFHLPITNHINSL